MSKRIHTEAAKRQAVKKAEEAPKTARECASEPVEIHLTDEQRDRLIGLVEDIAKRGNKPTSAEIHSTYFDPKEAFEFHQQLVEQQKVVQSEIKNLVDRRKVLSKELAELGETLEAAYTTDQLLESRINYVKHELKHLL